MSHSSGENIILPAGLQPAIWTPEPVLPEAPTDGYVMSPDEELAVKLDGQHMASAEDNKLQFGRTVPTLAEIVAGRQLFTVLDMRGKDHDSPLMIVDSTYNAITKSGPHKGYKNIRPGDTVHIGRNHFTDRFGYDNTVSRSHFDLSLRGLKLVVRNKQPMNSTRVSGDIIGSRSLIRPLPRPTPVVPRPPTPLPKDYAIIDDYTKVIGRDAAWRHDFGIADTAAVYGYHKNHPIIGRESKSVKGGVYFTRSPMSEAVVVDDRSAVLQRASTALISYVKTTYGESPKITEARDYRAIARTVERYADALIPYDLLNTELMCAPYRESNGLIGLSDFMERKMGVCRHQCLLVAFLLETLVEQGYMQAEVAVERNHDVEARGAHAWALLRTPHENLVVDSAQHFVGTKAEARALGRWKYHLNSPKG